MTDQRLAELFEDFEETVKDFIRRHELTYQEYNATVAWLSKTGKAGEYPLVMDVLLESIVNKVNYGSRPGTTSTIEGPYYVGGAPKLSPP